MKSFIVKVLVAIAGFAGGFLIGHLWCSLSFVNSYSFLRSWIINTVITLPIAIFFSTFEQRFFWKNVKGNNDYLAPFSAPFWMGYIGYLYLSSNTLKGGQP